MKLIKGLGVILVIVAFGSTPQAASMLGVSTYAATKVVDAIMAGMGFWSIIALVASGAGAMAVVMGGMRAVVKRVGRRAAIAW